MKKSLFTPLSSRLSVLLLIVLLSVIPAMAAAPVVSLLICEPGSEIYELDGHAALRVRHDVYGDFTVNWGVFNFNAPGFVYRFVKGETDYIAAAAPTDYFVQAYETQGRSVKEYDLRLDSVQAEQLTEAVLRNIQPENRTYRYNYVLDNCATRPLAIVENIIGDTLSLATPPLSAQERSTFRNVMRHYHAAYPWYQFGIDTALGSGIDRLISERESTFSPLLLGPMIEGATLPDGTPAITDSRYLVGSASSPSVVMGPTPWILTPMAVGLLILALSLTVSIGQLRGRCIRGARWFDSIWFSIEGLEGLLLTFLIFVSVHEATSPNWLYLWLNPLCFIGAVTPWLKNGARLQFTYQSVNFALLMVLAGIFIAGIQSPNPAFFPIMAATLTRSATIIYMYLHSARLKK